MKKIKIAWLHSHFLLNTGGTRYVYENVKRLKKDFSITIFVEKTNREWFNKYKKIGVNVVSISPFSSNNPLYWLAFPLLINLEKNRLLNLTKKFDLVISSMFPMNWIASFLQKPNIQICYEPFAFFYDEEFIKSFSLPKQLFSQILSKLYSSYDKYGVLKSERILTFNQGVADWIQKIYKRTTSAHIRIGVDTKLFQPTTDKQLAQKHSGYKVIMHSTDYTSIKGTEFLIKSLPFIVSKVKNVKVLISESVSDPSSKEKIINLATKLKILPFIEFLGSVPYQDLPKYYTLASVYVFTGHPKSKGATSASLSVLEALSCATPVVRGIGTTDEVIDGKSGYIVNPEKSKLLADRVVDILKHPQKARSMGLAGKRHVAQGYTWDHVADNIKSQVNQLMITKQDGFEIVKYRNKIVGMVFRRDVPVKGIRFFTDDMNPFQVGMHHQPKGVKLVPHVHKLHSPIVLDSVQEMVVIQKGKAKLTFYTSQGKIIKTFILNEGDSSLFVSQGHGLEFLEETRTLIIKQGPFPGTEHAKIYLNQ